MLTLLLQKFCCFKFEKVLYLFFSPVKFFDFFGPFFKINLIIVFYFTSGAEDSPFRSSSLL